MSSSVMFVSFKEGTFFEAGSHSLLFLFINRIQNTRFEQSRKITMENRFGSSSFDFYPIYKPVIKKSFSFFQRYIPFVCVCIQDILNIKGIKFNFFKVFFTFWLFAQLPKILGSLKMSVLPLSKSLVKPGWSNFAVSQQTPQSHLIILWNLP